MKSVLISIQPKWCELIAKGKKTIEVRKTRPKLETPFKCYIYCTKSTEIMFTVFLGQDREVEYLSGKVIGEFVCDRIDTIENEQLPKNHKGYENRKAFYNCLAYTEFTCLSYDELSKYVGYGISKCYGWHISDLKIYDTPKELGEFRNTKEQPFKRPFQSWGYVNA